jgi:CheY-like chemotaxis protein
MSATVLVVEDNESNVALIRAMLLNQGYEVRIARDGASAIESVRQRRPDVVLLDVMMPGMYGMQVLDRLKLDPKTTAIPVIMVTGKTEDKDVLAGYESGADYYITKPFTARQLLYAIGLVLGGGEATD